MVELNSLFCHNSHFHGLSKLLGHLAHFHDMRCFQKRMCCFRCWLWPLCITYSTLERRNFNLRKSRRMHLSSRGTYFMTFAVGATVCWLASLTLRVTDWIRWTWNFATLKQLLYPSCSSFAHWNMCLIQSMPIIFVCCMIYGMWGKYCWFSYAPNIL